MNLLQEAHYTGNPWIASTFRVTELNPSRCLLISLSHWKWKLLVRSEFLNHSVLRCLRKWLDIFQKSRHTTRRSHPPLSLNMVCSNHPNAIPSPLTLSLPRINLLLLDYFWCNNNKANFPGIDESFMKFKRKGKESSNQYS